MSMQSPYRGQSAHSGPSPQHGQLSLIELSEPVVVDPRFRLSDHTRRLGLLNIARARVILAEAAEQAEHRQAA